MITNKNELKGTNYMEVFPGKHTNEFWSAQSVFFDEDSFCYIEDIFEMVNNSYDHFSLTEYSQKQLNEIRNLLKDRLNILNSEGTYPIKSSTFKDAYCSELQNILENNKQEIITMIEGFYLWLSKLKSDEITVLGM